MASDQDKSKLIFIGNSIHLTDDEIVEMYKLESLDEEELTALGLTRQGVIDDYRFIHELSEAHRVRETAKDVPKEPAKEEPPKTEPEQNTSTITTTNDNPYSFELLNKLYQLLKDINFHGENILENVNIERDWETMTPLQREYHRFLTYCNQLNKMYLEGEEHRAINITIDALIAGVTKLEENSNLTQGNPSSPPPPPPPPMEEQYQTLSENSLGLGLNESGAFPVIQEVVPVLVYSVPDLALVDGDSILPIFVMQPMPPLNLAPNP